jgi:hypothetical protein
MENTNAKFEVGDWILLNDEALAKLLNYSSQNSKSYIENYKYPRQVLSITTTTFNGSSSFLYVTGKAQKVREREFRLATEKEIKEYEIRSKFIIK